MPRASRLRARIGERTRGASHGRPVSFPLYVHPGHRDTTSKPSSEQPSRGGTRRDTSGRSGTPRARRDGRDRRDTTERWRAAEGCARAPKSLPKKGLRPSAASVPCRLSLDGDLDAISRPARTLRASRLAPSRRQRVRCRRSSASATAARGRECGEPVGVDKKVPLPRGHRVDVTQRNSREKASRGGVKQ